MATTDLERQTTSKVDEADVPSRDWGWSGTAPNAARIAGILFAGLLVFMVHGNHTGLTEDAYLIGFAVLIVGTILVQWLTSRRKKWKY